MKAIKLILQLLWVVGQMAVVFILFYKVWRLNNVHFNLTQDPLEQWIAIGIAYIICEQLRKGD